MENQETNKGTNVVIEVKPNATQTIKNDMIPTEEEIKIVNTVMDNESETVNTVDDDKAEFKPDNSEIMVDQDTSKQTKQVIYEIVDEEEGEPLDENPEGLAGEAMSLLGKFKTYIGSDKFDNICADAADKHGVEEQAVKNAFIRNALGTIANILNLTVSIAGDIITSAVHFIDGIVNTVVDFSATTLRKLVKILTLNCGTIAY